MMEEKIRAQMQDAERKAWEALAGYKFWMFGYHAGRWINYKNLLGTQERSPFSSLVAVARRRLDEMEGQAELELVEDATQ